MPVPKDLGRTGRHQSDSGTYLVESIEYVSGTDLPPNELFDDPVALASLLAYTKSSIEERAAAPDG